MNLDNIDHDHITNNNHISCINDTNDSDDNDDLSQDAKRSMCVVFDAENNNSNGLSLSSSVAGLFDIDAIPIPKQQQQITATPRPYYLSDLASNA
jgi:hypothetical protein